MNQTILRPNKAKLDKTKHTNTTHQDAVDVYSAGVTIHDDDLVVIRPNVIDSKILVSQNPVFVHSLAQPIKSQYQIDIESQKRIQTLRTQAILQSHNNNVKKNTVVKKGTDNWKLILVSSAVVLLLALFVWPFFNHVTTALAAF